MCCGARFIRRKFDDFRVAAQCASSTPVLEVRAQQRQIVSPGLMPSFPRRAITISELHETHLQSARVRTVCSTQGCHLIPIWRHRDRSRGAGRVPRDT